MGKTTFDVTYVSEGNVTNIPETLAVLYKDQITVSDLTPVRDGYTFIGWKLYSNVVTGGNRLIMPFSDVTLTAIWEKDKFNINFETEGTVANMPENILVEYDTQHILTNIIPERTGYTFIGWKLYSNVVIGGNRLIIPFSDVTLAAVLEKKYFNITFESEGTVANIRENVLAEYDTQHIVSNVVPEDEGYTFIGWKLWDTLLDKELN